MITSLAVDREFAYTLDEGVITRHKLNALGSAEIFTGPGGDLVIQVMTTNEATFTLSDTGTVYRRDVDTDSWEPVPVPDGVTYLSSDDSYLYVLIDGKLFQQYERTGPFTQVPDTIAVNDLAQVDFDEQFGYVLLNTGVIWMRKTPDGDWFRFPDLPGVIQIAAGLNFIYARTNDGNVHRSHTYSESRWETLNSDNVALLAIASDHSDKLWMIRRQVLESVGVLGFVSIFDFNVPVDTAWIDADWIDEDWIEVA